MGLGIDQKNIISLKQKYTCKVVVKKMALIARFNRPKYFQSCFCQYIILKTINFVFLNNPFFFDQLRLYKIHVPKC